MGIKSIISISNLNIRETIEFIDLWLHTNLPMAKILQKYCNPAGYGGLIFLCKNETVFIKIERGYFGVDIIENNLDIDNIYFENWKVKESITKKFNKQNLYIEFDKRLMSNFNWIYDNLIFLEERFNHNTHNHCDVVPEYKRISLEELYKTIQEKSESNSLWNTLKKLFS